MIKIKNKSWQILLPIVLVVIIAVVVIILLTQCEKKPEPTPAYAKVSVQSSLCENDEITSWVVNSFEFKQDNESKNLYSNPANFELYDASWYIRHEYTIKNLSENSVFYVLAVNDLQSVNCAVTCEMGEGEEDFAENLIGNIEANSELKIIIYLRIVDSNVDANFNASFSLTLTKGN